MRNLPTTTSLLGLLALLFLTACTTNPRSEHPDSLIQAQDYETADLADITADTLKLAQMTVKENILVVFDIDNTLLAMEQGLGSDQWYEWQKEFNRC